MWSEWDLSWAPTEIILVSTVSRPSFHFGARAVIHWSTRPRWSGGLVYGTGLKNGTGKSAGDTWNSLPFSIISRLPVHTRGKGAFQFGDGSFLCSYHECDWSLQTQPGEVVLNRPACQRVPLPHYCRITDLIRYCRSLLVGWLAHEPHNSVYMGCWSDYHSAGSFDVSPLVYLVRWPLVKRLRPVTCLPLELARHVSHSAKVSKN